MKIQAVGRGTGGLFSYDKPFVAFVGPALERLGQALCLAT